MKALQRSSTRATLGWCIISNPFSGPGLVVISVVMAAMAAVPYRLTAGLPVDDAALSSGPARTAGCRRRLLAAAMTHMPSSALVLSAMFVVANQLYRITFCGLLDCRR